MTEYTNPAEERINFGIINRVYERSLSEYVVDCFKSIESVVPEIKLVESQFIVDVDEIDINKFTRSRKKKKDEPKYAFVNDDRVGELRLKFVVHLPNELVTDIPSLAHKYGSNNYYIDEDGCPIMIARVSMMIPVPDEKGYYYINGKRYISIYQLSEASTYVSKNVLVLKSLLPIEIRKMRGEFMDTQKVSYQMNYFEVKSFNKFRNIMYFYFATMGWDNALAYFSIDKYIEVADHDCSDEEYTCFKIRSDTYLKVYTKALRNDYFQSMLGSILNATTTRMTTDSIKDKNTWIDKIGSFQTNADKSFHHTLGLRQLTLFNRMLDETTKDVLRFENSNKRDVYAVIRTLVQNYKAFKSKDNLDIVNKRLRCNEYVASLLNLIISEKVKVFINKTCKTNQDIIDKYRNLFSYRGTELISKAHSSGLIKVDDIVNDMDFFQKLKITTKGPNSLGSKNSRNISAAFRSLHPSHIGRLDLNVCSQGDPGLTNILTPLVETDGLYFKDAPRDSETGPYDFMNEMGEFSSDDDVIIVDPVKYNSIIDYAAMCGPTNIPHVE